VAKEREIKRLKAENERLTRARDQYHKLWRDVNLQNMIYQQDPSYGSVLYRLQPTDQC
jgi:histone deacetylase complex regulatory component SIN3